MAKTAKKESKGKTGGKSLSPYHQFMKTEIAKLKAADKNISHKVRDHLPLDPGDIEMKCTLGTAPKKSEQTQQHCALSFARLSTRSPCHSHPASGFAHPLVRFLIGAFASLPLSAWQDAFKNAAANWTKNKK